MQRRHRVAHRRIWTVLLVALPLVLLTAVALRRTGPAEAPAVQMSQPR